jgi:hypothetical protein
VVPWLGGIQHHQQQVSRLAHSNDLAAAAAPSAAGRQTCTQQ